MRGQSDHIGPNAVTTTTNIDVKKLVARFGGQGELCRRMNAKGYAVSLKAIEKWISRDSLPGKRILQLFELGISEGHPIDLYGFLLRPNAEKKLSPTDHEKNKQDRAG
jgi:hypothetical protein